MKEFETLNLLDSRSYLSSIRMATDFYSSSDRVNTHEKIAMTTSTVSKFIKIALRHGKSFSFMHQSNIQTMETMREPLRLKENCCKVFPEHGQMFYRAM